MVLCTALHSTWTIHCYCLHLKTAPVWCLSVCLSTHLTVHQLSVSLSVWFLFCLSVHVPVHVHLSSLVELADLHCLGLFQGAQLSCLECGLQVSGLKLCSTPSLTRGKQEAVSSSQYWFTKMPEISAKIKIGRFDYYYMFFKG